MLFPDYTCLMPPDQRENIESMLKAGLLLIQIFSVVVKPKILKFHLKFSFSLYTLYTSIIVILTDLHSFRCSCSFCK